MTAHTIGQLARAAGVPTSTVRYYERVGLLKPDFRTGANYRAYSDDALKRLRFIRAAQATGFNLSDVHELLSLTCSAEPPCDDVLNLMRARLDGIRTQIKQLRQLERTLARTLDACCNGEGPDICDDICRLNNADRCACGPHGKKSAATP
jgi:DNA-binding transcriptional MerR regulator